MTNDETIGSIDPDLGPDGPAQPAGDGDRAGGDDREGVRDAESRGEDPHGSGGLRQLREVLEGQRTCMLSTIDAQGRIVSRPMAMQGDEKDFTGELWFLTRADAGKVGEIEQDSHANVAFSKDGAWASISGRASVVDDVAKKRELWDASTDVWFGDAEPEDPSIVLVRVDGEHAEYWSSYSAPRVLVEIVKGKIEGRQPDTGTEGSVSL